MSFFFIPTTAVLHTFRQYDHLVQLMFFSHNFFCFVCNVYHHSILLCVVVIKYIIIFYMFVKYIVI